MNRRRRCGRLQACWESSSRGRNELASGPSQGHEPERPAPAAVLQPVEMVRLPAENLDRLVRSTGQILSESLRQVEVSGELNALDDQIAEMSAESVRFRKAASAPLWRVGELSRSSRR